MPKAMSDAELGGSNDGDQDAVEKSHGLLILLRHGESMWNRSSEHPNRLWRYAGSNDVALSEQGIHEALEAGDRLAKIHIDVVFASCLSRAMNTCMIALAKHVSGLTPIIANREGSYAAGIDAVSKLPENTVVPIICSEKLNERCFGELQGMPSTEHLVRYKKEYLQEVRNKFDVRFPGPKGESTEDVFHRVVPYFEENILPLLREGKNVLLCSHGFSIRALIKYLDGMSDEEFNLEMRKEKRDPENCKLLAATGVPLLYRFDRFAEDGLHPKKIGAIDRAYELAHTCAPY
ncbi:Phosphoglycerate mutase 2 [Hondaea fermentalgiana]|uniref:phosphoglycerate mutase (2,3-diphosphoglycerate-dependent) n=1 Tax=Hondaea fermentalgiana TaxID=2315210 RepID=A0A2R5GDJ7_9STRA|nr:Phosphoglycerate mutase 2 [Hondaea fermentalgiana]|eukprot:GBG28379.1 Phosphoglycerate mutase 2 [Hondaea fermentalgiana]